MARTASLMPETADARERAISEAVAAWWDIPVELLGTLWDPFKCPPAVLPHLARALGMALWLDRWTLAQRRSYIARWVALSRKRGVEGTFRELIGQVDAELVEFLAPPQGLFPKQHWTPAERAAWRAQFPELRVYPFRGRHNRPGGFVVGGFLGKTLRQSVASDYAGRRATVTRDGIERPVALRVTGSLGDVAAGQFRVTLPTKARKLILPAILGRDFIPRTSTATSRAYTFADGPGDPDLLLPGQVLDVKPERTRQAHTAPPGGFTVGAILPLRLRASVAREHVFDSVRLYDPEFAVRGGPVRKGGWVLGRSKLRQSAFTLRLSVDASRKRRGGFVIGGCLPMISRRFDQARVDEVYAAARAAKLGRDKVLIRFGLHRTITAGDNLPVDGTFRTGQIIRSI